MMRYLITTFLLLACVSCSKQPVPHAVITVSDSNPHILYDSYESVKQESHALAGPTNKLHNPLVIIQLSSGATYELAEKAIDMCVGKGLWKVELLDESGVSVEDEYLEWKKTHGVEQQNAELPPAAVASDGA